MTSLAPPVPAETPGHYADNLRTMLSSRADPVQAGPMRAYMKDQFPFFGIKPPLRASLVRAFVSEHGLRPISAIRG